METAEMADKDTPLTIPALAWHSQAEVQHLLKIEVEDDPKPKAKVEDEDPDDDEDDDPDDDEDEDPDADLADMSPEDLRAALKGARANLSKVNGESARHRSKRNEYRKEIEALKAASATKGKKKSDDDEDDDGPDVEKITSEAKKRADERIIRAEAKTGLVRAGLDTDGEDGKKRLTKALRLLDMSDIEVDDDDEVDGLDDALAELKTEFPELFRKGRKRRSVNGSDSREERTPRKLSASERQAAALGGGKR